MPMSHVSVLEHERSKYEKAWSMPGYLKTSPGASNVEMFKDMVDPQPGDSVIDLGCGAGAGGKALTERFDLNVTYCDFVKVDGVPDPFIEQTLWAPLPTRNPPWKYGYCCDVMEHIPPEYTMLVVRNIMDACETAFFSISFMPDNFGKFVGEPLHLTIMAYSWWRDQLAQMGELVEARDVLGEGVFLVKRRNSS